MPLSEFDFIPPIYLNGISLKRTWGGEVRNVSTLIVVGVREDGHPLHIAA